MIRHNDIPADGNATRQTCFGKFNESSMDAVAIQLFSMMGIESNEGEGRIVTLKNRLQSWGTIGHSIEFSGVEAPVPSAWFRIRRLAQTPLQRPDRC